MSNLRWTDQEIFEAIYNETVRENSNIELIASENFASEEVLEAQGSVFTNKYAEGYPHARWYDGCEYVDKVESLAIERAKTLFHVDHANVQPHSGAQANMAVFFATLKMGDTVLSMDLACGGHLTHGHPHNFSGRYFKVVTYGVNRKDERIDYDEVLRLAKIHKPKMIIAGASAYPRVIDFKKFREIADKTGAFLLVDMAHIAGLVAAGVHPGPQEYAEFITTTTHKTLRGPRGGMVLCRKEFAKEIDAQVFPGIQGGPLVHVIAAKAVAFKEAMSPEFKEYQLCVTENARTLAEELKGRGDRIISGGTDNHLILVDLTSRGITGKEAAHILDRAGITVNKNLIPFDSKGPFVTSGIRLGTPAVTTRGMGVHEMLEIAGLMDDILSSKYPDKVIPEVRDKVGRLANRFPIYTERLKAMNERDCFVR